MRDWNGNEWNEKGARSENGEPTAPDREPTKERRRVGVVRARWENRWMEYTVVKMF